MPPHLTPYLIFGGYRGRCVVANGVVVSVIPGVVLQAPPASSAGFAPGPRSVRQRPTSLTASSPAHVLPLAQAQRRPGLPPHQG